MFSHLREYSVIELQKEGVLLVEDGNHGEYRPQYDEFVKLGTAFIRAGDLANGKVLFEQAEKINETALQRIRKGIGKPGDVLLSHKGTVGRVAITSNDCPSFVCSPQTTFYRSLNENIIDRKYLYYFLCSSAFQSQLDKVKGETDMADYVSLTTQRNLKINLLSIDDQRSIARILGSLDDKIDLNQQTNETLKAIAQALFKSWFVDFDPVKANAENRTLLGLAPCLQALFPATFEPSPLGDIPAGWSTRPLDGIANFLNGLACQKYPPEEESNQLPVIKIAELKQGLTEGTDKVSADIDPKYIITDGDIIFSWSGSLVVCIWCKGKGALNQHLFKVTSKEFPKWFYYQWVQYHLPEFQDIAASKATTMGHIKRHHLTDSLTVCPEPKLLEAMNTVMEPLLERIIQNEIESRTLAQLRDTLLPKLMNGELPISNAEAKVEALV